MAWQSVHLVWQWVPMKRSWHEIAGDGLQPTRMQCCAALQSPLSSILLRAIAQSNSQNYPYHLCPPAVRSGSMGTLMPFPARAAGKTSGRCASLHTACKQFHHLPTSRTGTQDSCRAHLRPGRPIRLLSGLYCTTIATPESPVKRASSSADRAYGSELSWGPLHVLVTRVVHLLKLH